LCKAIGTRKILPQLRLGNSRPLRELDHRVLGDLAMYGGPVSGRESRYFISERSAAVARSLRFIHHFAVNCTV
jgi:hypothetical protein